MEGVNKTYLKRLRRDMKKNWVLYLLFIPVLAYFILFCYVPLYGILMAFYDYVPALGFSGSNFVGLQWFTMFFKSAYFGRVMRNTVLLNVYSVIFVFPVPILFALLLYEIKTRVVVKCSQILTYLPVFISLVVVCGIIVDFCKVDGVVSNIVATLTGEESKNLLDDKNYYYPIYIISDIWQNMGFSSIVFCAALCRVDAELYDAAKIDGAGRFRQLISITIPSILPIITIMFIIRMGSMLNVGFEKAYLLKRPLNSENSEVIATFVYDRGIGGTQYGYATAVGLFSAVINFAFLWTTNLFAKRTENSLW